MELFKIPLVNQSFVAVGVLSTILSCGIGLGYIAAYIDNQKNDETYDVIAERNLLNIEICGEIAFVSSILIIPFIMQMRGRRIAAIITTLPLLLSWIISFFLNNNAAIIVNVLQNISLGGAVSTSSIIISEFCSPKYRGAILMLETAMISLGALISHALGMYSYWRLIFSLGILTSTISLLSTYFWLESPYWLVSEGHIMKCTENFYRVRGYNDETCKELEALLLMYKVKIQLQSLKPIKKLDIREQVIQFIKTLLKADFLKPLSIMILLFSFAGFGGENVTSHFSFRDILTLTNGKYIGTIILDVLTFICSLIACVLIHIVKRKTLFMFTGSFSIIFLGASCLLLFLQSLGFFYQHYVWLLLSFSTGFAMFMSLGTTALPLSLLGEIFPMSYKGVGCSLTCAYLWAFGNTILKSIPYFTRSVGLPSIILLFCIFMIGTLLILNKILPETNCKTLIEIDQLINANVLRNEDYRSVSTTDDEDGDIFNKLNLFLSV